MKRFISIVFILFQLFAIAYYGYLRIHNASYVREPRSFGDTEDYLHNAGLSVFSKEFWTDARPPITALFWKAVDSDPIRIFKLQLHFSILGWAVLAYFVTLAVRSYLLKPILISVVLAFSLSRDIYMWDPFLGSESIALSFTALFLAAAIWMFLEWKIYKAVLLIVIALLMVLTRDTYAYFLLMVALVSVPVFWSGKYRGNALAVSFAFLLIFALSSQLAEMGLRPYRAVLMNTALRIYPSDTYTEYFRAHGMPVDDRLVAMSRNIQPGKKFVVYTSLLSDPNQWKYRQWVSELGQSEYIKFLLFFKADTFQKILTESSGQAFTPDVFYYTATGYRTIIKDTRISEFLYPTRFGLFFFYGANMLAAFLAAIGWVYKKSLWYIPLLMVLLSYPQAVLVWAADVNDIARHSISHNVLMRLGLWVLVFFVLDFLLANISTRFSFFKQTELSAQ